MKQIYTECLGPWVISVYARDTGDYQVDSYHMNTKERRDNVKFEDMNIYERTALNAATGGTP